MILKNYKKVVVGIIANIRSYNVSFLIYYFAIILLGFLHVQISINGSNSVVSIIYFLLCSMILYDSYSKINKIVKTKYESVYLLKWAIYFIISIGFIFIVINKINKNPLNYKDADMLPIIETMSNRFIKNKPIYEPIEEIWGGMQPIYLPAMWLPYTIPKLLNVDIRWINVVAILISFLLLFSSTTNFKKLISLSCFYLFCLYYFIFVYTNYLLQTQESIILLYISILLFAIYRQNWKLIFIAFTLCAFSRYWIIICFPFLFFYYLKYHKFSFYDIFPSLFLILFFIIITPLSQYKIWIGLPTLYQNALLDPSNSFKYTPVIDKFGLIKILPNSYRHLITIIGIVFTTICLLYLFLNNKKTNNYLLLIVATTNVFMLLFIIIPYEYLMFTIPYILYLFLHFKCSKA